ncbi:single-stranded-DNA-specific exonuclease RecJ [Serpentinicella sp. ANB-PHB4]|uniref:single-stranded-DNA-specific exonuclease RecJ n=1 Tax=Serpentinicella sp. ANB-PHB4 TaxID=3074076 RepID=UPI002F3F1975
MHKWLLKNIVADYDKISKKLNISTTMCRLLFNRNIRDYNQIVTFLSPTLDKLHNPRKMKDIEKGSSIILDAIVHHKKIRISSDYDSDGVVSLTVLLIALQRCGADVDYVIPDRVKDGYGINERIVTEAKKDGIDVILTCDNGIAAVESIQLAKDLGLKVIVTDHHDVPFQEDEKGNKTYILPPADAIINPKRSDCSYKFDKLCGAGVALKLIQVVFDELNIPQIEAYQLLQFVAIATVCDVVDLVDENRIIVDEGLKHINSTSNIGLRALIEATGLDEKKIGTYELGFKLGPCINASGRLESAEIATELFMTKSPEKAKEYAKKLYELNEQRKEITVQGIDSVIKSIESSSICNDKVIVVYEPTIHESIAGIVAGRIKEKYNKPTVILTNSNDLIKGSGRSIEVYNMFEELSKCKDILVKFGGHPMAAGLSLEKSNIDLLRNKLNNAVTLTDNDLIPTLKLDLQLDINEINYMLIEELKELEPFGKANPRPIFGAKNIKVIQANVLGKNKNVIKLKFQLKGRGYIEAIYFGEITEFENLIRKKIGEKAVAKLHDGGITTDILIDIAYRPEINEFRGNKKIQLIIDNFK